jgi:hypothetical protein
MKTFRELAQNEALKIVKKKTEQNDIKPISKPETKIDISHFDDCKIIRTNHTKEVRNGQAVSRDDGLRDAIILKTIKKAWKKGLKPNTKTMITYKVKSKKQKAYDMIVIEWKSQEKKIILITSIQDGKDAPKWYFGAKHKHDEKIMTEVTESAYEILIEIEEI